MERRLRRAVVKRLAAVEEMAARAGSQSLIPGARNPGGTVAEEWRQVLIGHQPDLNGRCPMCSGWLRRRRWPCQLWMIAHGHLIGGKPEPTRSAAKKSNPLRDPRRVEVIPRQVSAPTAAEQSAAHRPDGVGSQRAVVPVQEPTVSRSRRDRLSRP
ncbi:MAG: hypothetical protein ACRDTC_04775 [Pseudonocardiaceae bacterium]